MKRKPIALALGLLMILSACTQTGDPTGTPAPSEATTPENTASAFTPGTYTGVGEGRNGNVELNVTFDADKIVSVDVVSSKETKGIGSVAVEKMAEQAVEVQQVPDLVSGATQSSVAMYAALVDAITQAGGDSKALTQPLQHPAPAQAVEECEVVVVGGGGSGLTAAIELKEKGVDVILVEKEGIFGGTSLTASSYIPGYGTSVHQKAGVMTTVEEFEEGGMLALMSGLPAYPEMAEKFLKIIPETLEDYMAWGADLSNLINGTDQMGPADGSTVGSTLLPAIIDQAEKMGVDMRLNNKATELLREGDKVTGVKVSTKGGDYEIHAKAVLMTTGGYQQNKEIVEEYTPQYAGFATTWSTGSEGEGLLMCLDAGGYLQRMDTVVINPTGYMAKGADNLISFSNFRYYGCILVGASTGRRFWNELGDYTSIAMNMPEGHAYAVFDQTVFNTSSAIQEYFDLGYIVKADTVEELAKLIGVDEATLKETVEKYSASAKAGVDEEFERPLFPSDLTTAPYYATPVQPALHNNLGGVVTDVYGRVQREDGSFVPGLYAANGVTGSTIQPVGTMGFVYSKVIVEGILEDMGK